MLIMLFIASITDLRKGKIYNSVTYPAIIIGVLGHWLIGGLTGATSPESAGIAFDLSWVRALVGYQPDQGLNLLGLSDSLLGVAIAFVPMFIARAAGGLGGGDLKAMTAIGALGGWRFALSAMFYSLLAALVICIIVLIVNRMTIRTLKRIGTFLFLLFLKAKPTSPSDKESPKVAIGVAFTLGTLAVLILTKIFGPNESIMLLGI